MEVETITHQNNDGRLRLSTQDGYTETHYAVLKADLEKRLHRHEACFNGQPTHPWKCSCMSFQTVLGGCIFQEALSLITQQPKVATR